MDLSVEIEADSLRSFFQMARAAVMDHCSVNLLDSGYLCFNDSTTPLFLASALSGCTTVNVQIPNAAKIERTSTSQFPSRFRGCHAKVRSRLRDSIKDSIDAGENVGIKS